MSRKNLPFMIKITIIASCIFENNNIKILDTIWESEGSKVKVLHSEIVRLFIISLLLTGCVTDREALNIGEWERFDAPPGMFQPLSEKRNEAVIQVIYYFKSNREALLEDTGLTLRTIAYFEWLSNDLRRSHDVTASSLRKMLDARDDLRKTVNIPLDASSEDAVNQLYSMSKFITLANKNKAKEDPEIAEYRRFLSKAKGEVNRLLLKAREEKDSLQNSGPNGGGQS